MNQPSVTIRRELQAGDIGEITRLHGVVYGAERGYGMAFEAYVAQSLAEFYHQHDPARDAVWICEDGGRIVGTLFLKHRDDCAQLRYFLIVPEFRGSGLGKLLMDEFMQTLRRRGYARAYLRTTSELDAAAALYGRHGFVLVEEHPSTRFGLPLTEQKYEWIDGV